MKMMFSLEMSQAYNAVYMYYIHPWLNLCMYIVVLWVVENVAYLPLTCQIFGLINPFLEVDFLWNRTVDSSKTSFHPLLWTSSGLRDSCKTTPYMGNGKLTEHAQNLQGYEKCNLRKAVGNLEMPYGCEITVIVQDGLKTVILVSYIS